MATNLTTQLRNMLIAAATGIALIAGASYSAWHRPPRGDAGSVSVHAPLKIYGRDGIWSNNS